MIIHISRERYEHIRGQGWKLGTFPASSARKYPTGDTEFHLLDGDHGLCETCGVESESIVASDPAELDAAKYHLLRMEEFRNLAAQAENFA